MMARRQGARAGRSGRQESEGKVVWENSRGFMREGELGGGFVVYPLVYTRQEHTVRSAALESLCTGKNVCNAPPR